MTTHDIPYTPETAAADAAEAIRALCHKTIVAGFVLVPGVYSISADLGSMAHRTAQACHQLAHNLEHRLIRGGLQCDDGSDPATPIYDAFHKLFEAAGLAADLGIALHQAQAAIAMVSDTP